MSFLNGDKNWLSPDEILLACSLSLPGTLGPHPDQSVRCVRDLIRRWATAPEWPLGRPDDEGLIVLAVDSVGYHAARDFITADELVCLTSTFPSTSAVAWVSSVTGCQSREHRVSGPVGLQPGVDGVYNILRALAYSWDGGAMVTTPARPDPFPAHRTAFDDVTAVGWGASVLLGDFGNVCRRWADLLVGGGRRVEPPAGIAEIRHNGPQVAQIAIEQIDNERATGGRQCIWAYINLDEHAHRYGYDSRFEGALRSLVDAAERWSSSGQTVVFYSDHGQVPNKVTTADVVRFDAIAGATWCRLPPGGAGRVRWIYPRAGREEVLMTRMRDLLGEDAVVCHRDELPGLGVVPAPGLPGSGEIVAIATGDAFPVPDSSYIFEHGSFTEGEMLVPLAVWGPR
jgi:hypothetical protein